MNRTRARLLVSVALVITALAALSTPASAAPWDARLTIISPGPGSYSWTLECSGDFAWGAQWSWSRDGVPVPEPGAFEAPSARWNARMAYDAESDRVILFGGFTGGYSDETWAYDANTNGWTNMNPAMHPRGLEAPALAYDSGSDRVVLFGGYTGSALSDETWAYDFNANAWTAKNPGARPSARWTHAMAYDARSDRVILFGGATGSGPIGETWAYDSDADSGTNMNPSRGPSGRSQPAMAYDSGSDRIVLFGGADYYMGWYSDETC